MAATVRAAIAVEDNTKIVAWARQASVDEQRPVFVAEIMKRLIALHEEINGDVPPKPTKGSGEQARDAS